MCFHERFIKPIIGATFFVFQKKLVIQKSRNLNEMRLVSAEIVSTSTF